MSHVYDCLRVFGSHCKIRLARSMEFRIDFITGFIFSFTSSFGTILLQFMIYTNTRGYPGWTFDQILLFQAMVLLITGIRETIFGNVRVVFEYELKYGNMDRILLFPVPSLGTVMVKGFQFNSLPMVLAGLFCLGYSIYSLQLKLQWWDWGLFLLLIVVGMIFHMAIIIIHCSLALRFINVEKLRELGDRLVGFGSYPAEIFSGLTKLAYLIFLPIATFIYFPVQALLGRLDQICLIGVGFSLAMFFWAIKLWDSQLKKYTGAGG